MAIISKKYANKLVREGKASVTTDVVGVNGRMYRAIDRFDLQRVDHFRIANAKTEREIAPMPWADRVD